MPDKDELDRLLDSALATYADPGPDSGLERRVLASLAAARQPRAWSGLRTRPWLPWAIAVPVLASVLLWIAVGRIQHVPSKQAQPAQEASLHAPVAVSQPGAAERKRSSGHRAHQARAPRSTPLTPCPSTAESHAPCFPATREVAKRAPLPKLDVFPTPQPLTAEEKTLAMMVYGGSKTEHEAVASPPVQSDAPLDIAALNIPPLASSGEGNK